ncbi:OprD family porin [Erwinia tracheiphila]|uniref:Outer membrane porin, OprD family n=1 Tax=Erwinia tracheiphila TaxID=65700 RepID=A0A345CP68_9GAMM|nr:OprD family outer membrane porin [Erwinia tracheiphila]AXF75235.1 outer membrane porin, OprD family [Erwinia tracheiphila]UIA82218.1 OprD family porin [Erwinia tracheiphila]UIA90814.1 OprD family porin [Erwinia tracheiphila]
MSGIIINQKTLVLAVAICTAISGSFCLPTATAAGFVDDSSLTGGIYYWQRHRDRKNMNVTSEKYGQYEHNLHHSTFNANLDFSSGYLADFIGFDLAAFSAVELGQTGPASPNEIGFSKTKSRWGERWDGDTGGVNLYKAAVKMKYNNYWLRGGYLQPTGQSLLAPQWSFMPGTYRGVEIGSVYDFADAGELSLSYFWANEYKSPWYRNMYNFRKADGITGINYLHSVGAKYDFKNNLIVEGAFGQAADYMDQYFTKVSYSFPVAGNSLRTNWQFYGAKDKESGGASNINDAYDGLAWLQALTLGYTTGPFDFRLEGTWVKAEGNQGFFLQRMTPGYATSNGRLDVWWNSRSDFNANGEKALFAGVMYDLKNWQLPGWAVGASYAYGWDARPSTNPEFNQNQRLRESTWNLDLLYTVQEGAAKGTLFKLHYSRYDNHSDLPSGSGGFRNIFQDEKDVRFIVIAPFTIF